MTETTAATTTAAAKAKAKALELSTEIKTLTDWTYYLGIFDGVVKTSAAAVYNDDWIFKIENANDKANTLQLLKSIYELVATIVENLNNGIDTLNTKKPIVYVLKPYHIDMSNFLTTATGQKPSVLIDAWNTVKPGITLMLPSLDKDPIMLETVQALLTQGQSLVTSASNLITGSKQT
jgi:hypothetical protein